MGTPSILRRVLFFSFWQSIFISILVAGGAISQLGPYTDPEHIALGLTDTLICLEMPLFALAHMHAFAPRDHVDPRAAYVARLPVLHALRDAAGLRDVVADVARPARLVQTHSGVRAAPPRTSGRRNRFTPYDIPD